MTKNILVIGGTGFVGKNIFDSSNYLYDINFNYYFLSGKNTLPFKSPNFNLLNFNYFDEHQLNYIFQNYNFDEVWLFLCSSVPSTSQNLLEFSIQNDLLYLIKLLNHIKDKKVDKIVYLSSGGTVYSGYSDVKFQEDFIFTPTSPYGILKTTMEHYIKYYHKNFGINYTILRVSNLFGPNHLSNNNGIINIAIRKVLMSEDVNIFGNGSIIKDFLFVSDFAQIYWNIIYNKDIRSNVINVGSGQLYSINYILQIIKEKLPQLKVNYIISNKSEKNYSEFSLDKLNSFIDLSITNINLAIQKTIQWEYQNLNK